MSATAGGGSTQTDGPATGPADRLGFKRGMVIQELGWDSDTDDQLRIAIEDAIDADMVDSDYGNVVDAVVLWWRDEDGDLVDGLVDSLTDLVGGGAIWLLTPKIGPNAVDAADIAEAAPIAGLSQTTTAAVSKDWSATRLIAPKTPPDPAEETLLIETILGRPRPPEPASRCSPRRGSSAPTRRSPRPGSPSRSRRAPARRAGSSPGGARPGPGRPGRRDRFPDLR